MSPKVKTSNNKVKDNAEKKVAVEIPQVALNYHKLSLEELARQFDTNILEGHNSSTANQLLLKNGPNKIKQKTENKFFKIVGYFLGGFGSLFIFAAIICILAWKPIGSIGGEIPDLTNLALGILLILVVIIQAGFNAFQDWSSQKVMNSIKNLMPSNAYVIRNGKEISILTEDIVVGDIIKLSYGNKVPADCRIIETKELKFDKSMLTGESDAIDGTVEATDESYVESKNIAYMTTLITNGQGKGLVVACGDNTMMGKIAGLTNQTKNKKTGLQIEIHRFMNIICTGAVINAIIVVITWSAWLRRSYPDYISVPALLVTTISVVIGFIPDGLPVSVTLSLLLIAMRMKKSRVLVKNLTVIETLSCVNVIASDKTGTLTQNKMFVSSAVVGMEKVDLDEATGSNFERTIGFNQLVSSCGLCNNASFEEGENDIPIKQRKAKGDATDIALLKFSSEYGNIKDITKNYDIEAEIPFNSKNKWMVKVVKSINPEVHKQVFGDDADINTSIVLLKGAPDYLLKKSTHIITPNGKHELITPTVTNNLVKIQNDLCLLGQRVLLICKKSCNLSEIAVASENNDSSDLEAFINRSNDFCVIGFAGIIDPPREGISDVLAKCKGAGIRVFMVTGDYALTAAAIATQIGILTQPQYDTVDSMRVKHKENHESYDASSLLLTGSDLENLSPEDWRLVTPYREIVFARTTPEQKLKTVKEFQKDGYIVGVTGDGVNDAPALKSADIGIAMGSGSEVAMEASQLVLLDNNFASILTAIVNGRLVFDNLRKVILFLLPAGSMGNSVPVFLSIFFGIQLNLPSFGMLVVALFTDIPPSLTMMKEPPETDLLLQQPRTKKDHLADRNFLIQAYCFMGILVTLSAQIMFFIFMKLELNLAPSQIFFSFDGIITNYNQSNWQQIQHFANITDKTVLRSYFVEHYKYAQTCTFTSLVILQTFGNLLCTRTHIKSFFQQLPWQRKIGNKWFFFAQFLSTLLMVIAVYIPTFNSLFNTRPVPVKFLFMPLVFCLIIFAFDELRKLCVRRKYLNLHKIAW